MEHELFQSKLKASVDGALITDMIRSSSSGLNSHRAATVELILERSIQERRERMIRKAKSSLRPDPTPQPKNEVPKALTSQVQSPTPAAASQPLSRSLPNDTTGIAGNLGWSPFNYRPFPDLPALSKPIRRVEEVARREEPPADVQMNPSSSEDFVELACWKCNVKQLRTDDVYGRPCISGARSWCRMKCTGCETIRLNTVDVCTTCHKKFK